MTEKTLHIAIWVMPAIVLVSFVFALVKLCMKMRVLKLDKELRDISKSR